MADHAKAALILMLGALSLTACSPLKLLNLAVPRTGYQLTRNVGYGPLPRQHLDIYTPADSRSPTPVVVFFYGGRWSSGIKADYRFVGQALASKGLVAVIPDYRLYPRIRFPAFIRDGAKAVRWTLRHIADYRGDSTCVYLMGHSAGAHIAAMLTLNKRYLLAEKVPASDVCGMIGLAGPYDFLPLTADDLKDMFAPARRLARTQPVNFVDGDEPPLLLMMGASDTTVKPANSFNLAERVRTAGGRVRLIEYPGRGHIGILLALAAPLRGLDPVLQNTVDFIRETSTRRARHSR